MATIAKEAVAPVQVTTDASPRVIVLPEAATVTAKIGELAYLNAGYVDETGDNPSNILGFFAEDGHNDSSAGTHNIAVYVAESTTIFRGNVYNGVAVADTTLAQTDIGKGFGLYRDTTNSKVYVSKDSLGSNLRVIVQDIVDAVGDTAGRVLFKIISKYRQLDTTS